MKLHEILLYHETAARLVLFPSEL